MKMARKQKVNLGIINDLKARSLEALKHGYALESALILFQTVEHLLRILISALGKNRTVDQEILLDCSEREQSFSRLITYFELLYPGNELTSSLKALNNKRNTIIHRLFTNFESIETLNNELHEFVGEAVNLNALLIKEMNLQS